MVRKREARDRYACGGIGAPRGDAKEQALSFLVTEESFKLQ